MSKMSAEAALQWLADLPITVRFRYLGINSGEGGYACILWVGRQPWWKGGGPEHIVEGTSEWSWEFDDKPTALDAVNSARYNLEREYWWRPYIYG